MKHLRETKIVPVQQTGRHTGAEAHRNLDTREEAIQVYQEAKSRLLNINQWGTYAGIASATFRLTDPQGNEVDREPELGDLIRIDIPGPGSSAGGGYDWVCIEAYLETIDAARDDDTFGFRVRPARNPKSDDPAPAHFYNQETTSTFLVQRAGSKVTAAEKGRNEVPNTDAERWTDRLRNSTIAFGASLGMAIPQWKALLEGILERADDEAEKE
jgi:hypothetical protein